MKLHIIILNILTIISPKVVGQDMGADDGGGGGEDMNEVDPSLIDLAAGDGAMGKDGLLGGMGAGGLSAMETLKLQTVMALQELGIVIGVAFLVGSIFMLMVYTEKAFNILVVKFNKKFGHGNPDEEADPAALVGTFKRCKN